MIPPKTPSIYRVGIDIGGTFTDLVAYDEANKRIVYFKSISTPKEPEKCFMDVIYASNIGLENIKVIIHATTLGTNMLLGQMGLTPPKILLITNKGFRDIIEIGRQNRPELYNLFFDRPKPLVGRRFRVGVKARIDVDGMVVEDIDEGEINRVLDEYGDEADVFVVAMLHSYRNPIHEERIKDIILKRYPNKTVVTSCEVDPQPKEYERFTTTIINALLIPIMSKYLDRILGKVGSEGFDGSLLVMRSDGGVSDIDDAIRKPAMFIESGPAAGAVATSYLSNLLGVGNAVGFDMGGTTAKASLVLDGSPSIVSEFEVGGKTHMGRVVKGSGYPLRMPHIDLVEVSAGGGTYAWVDEGGSLRVGPYSMGAEPGPACYGRGGDKPTITDANFLLGRLPGYLAGGEVVLDRDKAYSVLKRLADVLGMDVYEASYSILEIANSIMSGAIRIITVERGMDPRDFILFAYGGAGPLHAYAMMDIGFKEIIVPPSPGTFSAFGLLTTDYKEEFIYSVVKRVDEVTNNYIEGVFDSLSSKAVESMLSKGVDRTSIKIFRWVEMRYWGQGYELRVHYNGDLESTVDSFHKLHEVRYGYCMLDEDVEITLCRLTVIGIVDKPVLRRYEISEYTPSVYGYRDVYFGDGGWLRTKIYDRKGLGAGARLEGPAIIEEYDSTTLIPPNYSAYVDEFLNIHILGMEDG
jgi:N-methylhydantoinase A